MIIVKTKNGDIFLNEDDYAKIEHNANDHLVVITEYGCRGVQKVADVETVRFISHAQAADFTSTGSEIAKLQKQVELLTKSVEIRGNILRDFRYIYHKAAEFVEQIADMKIDPTDRWNGYVSSAKSIVEFSTKELNGNIHVDYMELDKLRLALEDVTKNRSV